MATRGKTNKRGGSKSWIYQNKEYYANQVNYADTHARQGFLMNFINGITGARLTDSQNDANAFSAAEAEKARQWAEQMYQENGTISAQRKQWEDAGFNPAMAMTGGNAVQPAPTTSSSPQSVSPTSGPSGLISLLSTVINAFQTKRQLDIEDKKADNLGELQKTQGKLAETQAGLTDTKNQLEQINLKYADAEKQLGLYKTREQINNIIEDTKLKGTQIEVNGEQINLMVTQEWLNQSNYDLNTQKILESQAQVEKILSSANLDRWSARKIEELLPYEKAFTEAQTVLANAKTDTEKADATLKLQQTSKALVDTMYQKRMLEGGYVEAIIDKTESEAVATERKGQFFKARTAQTYVQTVGDAVDDIVAIGTIGSKLIRAYTVDLLKGGSTTTFRNSKGDITGTSTTVLD